MATRVKVRIRLWRCPRCGRTLETIGEQVRCKCGEYMELVGAASNATRTGGALLS